MSACNTVERLSHQMASALNAGKSIRHCVPFVRENHSAQEAKSEEILQNVPSLKSLQEFPPPHTHTKFNFCTKIDNMFNDSHNSAAQMILFYVVLKLAHGHRPLLTSQQDSYGQ